MTRAATSKQSAFVYNLVVYNLVAYNLVVYNLIVYNLVVYNCPLVDPKSFLFRIDPSSIALLRYFVYVSIQTSVKTNESAFKEY